jgi:phage-related protein
MAARLTSIARSSQYAYIKASLHNGSAFITFRRYGSPLFARAGHARKSRYQVISDFEMDFRVLDPWWYFDTVRVAIVTVTGGTGSAATSDTGVARTKRAIVYITKTGSGTPTNVQVKNSSNHSFTMTGTLANVNDQWIIDMYAGTVRKVVSGVSSDDIANFSGRFWGVNSGTDTITVTDGGTAAFSVSVLYLERRM